MLVRTKLSKFFNRITTGRFSAFFNALTLYLSLCLVIRIVFLILSSKDIDPNPLYIARAFFTGFIFDLLTGLLYLCCYGLYLFLVPRRFIGSLFDKIATYFYFFLFFILMYFSLLAEIPFWDEFGVRFNFIAVDYLIYTYEVIENINQSYPLPLVIILFAGLVAFIFFLFGKLKVFQKTFSGKISFSKRIFYFIPIGGITILLDILLKNKQAEFSNNLVINELGKNGTFSFISAFRSNKLDYKTFYPKLPDTDAFALVGQNLLQKNQIYRSPDSTELLLETTEL